MASVEHCNKVHQEYKSPPNCRNLVLEIPHKDISSETASASRVLSIEPYYVESISGSLLTTKDLNLGRLEEGSQQMVLLLGP